MDPNCRPRHSFGQRGAKLNQWRDAYRQQFLGDGAELGEQLLRQRSRLMTIATPDRPLTAKQEAFTQAWLTNGFNAVLAYQTAYNSSNMQPATIRKEAVRVLQTPAIQLRIEQARAGNPLVPVPAATHDPRPALAPLQLRPSKPDKTWLLGEAVDLLILAKHTANLAQVRSALELIGKITGDLVDRKELRVVRSWSDLTDAEVDALAAGETIDATIGDEALDPSEGDEVAA